MLFVGNVPNGQIHRDRRQMRGCLELGTELWGVTANGHVLSFGGDENVLELVKKVVAHQCECPECH